LTDVLVAVPNGYPGQPLDGAHLPEGSPLLGRVRGFADGVIVAVGRATMATRELSPATMVVVLSVETRTGTDFTLIWMKSSAGFIAPTTEQSRCDSKSCACVSVSNHGRRP